MADFFADSGIILAWLISIIMLAAFIWRIAVWQYNRMKEDASKKEELWKKYYEDHAKLVKIEFENAMETVRLDVQKLDIKATKQLKRQGKRSDFTNSNVQKVRMDSLNNQVELYRIKQAMIEKGLISNDNGADSFFAREIKRKQAEIEEDARIQLPADDDE